MSLVNKMLNDLEKRDAFLYEKDNAVLNGLYSAYDVELNNKAGTKRISLLLVSLMIVSLIFLYSVFISTTDIDSPTIAEDTNQASTLPVVKNETAIDNSKIAFRDSLLKLDENLLSASVSNSLETNEGGLNRIDNIFIEKNQTDISLVMEMPENIDYLVYGLTDPSRVVIEVENAELGFMLEKLQPVEPIVAIRYSLNKDNRFKLVLESEQALNIKKSSTSHDDDSHNLVVLMQSSWQQRQDTESNQEVLADIIEQQVQVQEEQEVVLKGELVKNWVSKNSDAYLDNLFKQAYAAYQRGEISSSLKQLNHILDQDPAHVKTRSTLAMILSKQGHHDLAYSIMNEGLIQYPQQTEWIKVYARLLLGQDKVLKARQVMLRQQPELVSHVDYYALQSAILQKLNEHSESARIYRDLLQVNPTQSLWWMGLGISLESMKRYQDALYAYQKAYNNPSLASESRQFLMQRISQLGGLIKDEST